MDRSVATAVVAKTIAAHHGITHLRFTTSGSMSGAGSITVTTLARPASGKRAKGTYELDVVFLDSVRHSPWAQVATALEPNLPLSGGCAARASFDVDAAGTVTNRFRIPSGNQPAPAP